MNEFRKKISKLKQKDKLECFLLQSAYIEAILSKYFRFSIQLELNDKPNLVSALDTYITNVNGILKFSKSAKLFESDELIKSIDTYFQTRNKIVHDILEPIDDFEKTLDTEIEKGEKILEQLQYVEMVLEKVKTKEHSGFISGDTIQALTDLEKEIFTKYHINKKTREEIAQVYRITRQRVNQILSSAEKKIGGVSLNYKTNSTFRVGSKKLTPSIIIDSVCNFYNVSKSELLSQSRKAYLVLPRHVAMYLLRRKLNKSFPQIAKLMNRSDHTTAMHACTKMENLVSEGSVTFK